VGTRLTNGNALAGSLRHALLARGVRPHTGVTLHEVMLAEGRAVGAIVARDGDIGSFAGLRVDADARLLRADGMPVPGLHAVGNDMASVMGGTYPGPGITLSPALTFAVLAAERLAAAG